MRIRSRWCSTPFLSISLLFLGLNRVCVCVLTRAVQCRLRPQVVPLSLSQRQLSTPTSTGFAKLSAVKRSLQLCAPVHHGRNSFHPHSLPLSRPSLP